jgi:hypothetical protein
MCTGFIWLTTRTFVISGFHTIVRLSRVPEESLDSEGLRFAQFVLPEQPTAPPTITKCGTFGGEATERSFAETLNSNRNLRKNTNNVSRWAHWSGSCPDGTAIIYVQNNMVT